MIKKKVINYLNNEDLVRAIVEWQIQCRIIEKSHFKICGITKPTKAQIVEVQKLWPRQSDYIGRCILLICQGLGSKSNFGGYTYRDEMVEDAIEWCTNAIKTFDPARVGPKTGKVNNAFNYLTMVAYRAMQRRINTEKKQNATKHKNYQHLHIVDEAGAPSAEWINNDVSNRIIGEYEESLTKSLTKPVKSPKIKKTKKVKGLV
ncbi:MAG TPA: hypothetical protein VEP90_06245 [Methylomirabilota bacterium]|nr:hypothetical protein [Methylomirabilota bacterium]